MSGRIRSIKPELLDDAMTAGLSDCAFRLFIGLVLLADDYGNLRWEPAWLRAQVFWKAERPLAEVESAVRELQDARLVVPYIVSDQRYAAIRNWAKHQKVDKPGKARIPAPPEDVATPSRDSRDSLAPDPRSPIPTTDQGSPTKDPGPEEVPGERRFATGTPGIAARERYESAMARATGRPYGFKPSAIGNLCDLLNTHAKTEPTRGAALDWLERTLGEWVASADPKYTAGWSPVKLNDWLNEGRPKNGPKSNGRRPEEITKQPYDPNAPWMKAGES